MEDPLTRNDGNDGLWDELSHQQSREIAQHQARVSSISASSSVASSRHRRRTGSWSSLPVWNRIRDETWRFTNVFTTAAQEAWHDHQQRQRQGVYTHVANRQGPQRTREGRNMATDYLDDFGIPQQAGGVLSDDTDVEGLHYTTFGDSYHGNHTGNRPSLDTGNDFVFLPQLRTHRYRSNTDGWGAVANLDLYFSSLYTYYYNRGLVPIVGKGVFELTTLFFTLFLSVFLFAYIDWMALLSCIDEQSCKSSLSEYMIERPFQRWSVWNAIVISYCLLFILYGTFAVWSFVHSLQQAMEAKWVFEERLGISTRKLEDGAVDWDRDVVCKLMELQQSGEYRIAINTNAETNRNASDPNSTDKNEGRSSGSSPPFDSLVVAQRILRKENFLVALINRGLLDLTVPGFLGSKRQTTFFCSSLEWSLYFCILNFMFNHKYQIRPAFYLDAGALRRRFIVCGIAHAIFMPFLLFFMTLHFGLHNAYEWKSTKRYLGPHEWSLSAKWLFREFNELQHHFERRLAPSYEATVAYLHLFGQNEIMTVIGRILVFVGGSLGAVLIVFAAINDAILLHVKIADWNLLWFAGVLGVVYSIGKGMIPENKPRYTRNLVAESDEALANVAKYTHYYMETWKGRGADATTIKAISSMFQEKGKLFAHEIKSLIFAPYILCVSLANCSEAICHFIFSVKADIAGAGEVCGFSTFDFDRFEDEAWEGRTLGDASDSPATTGAFLMESILQTRNVEDTSREIPTPKTRHGKMEKSFFSFKATHPSWQGSASGQHLVDRVEKYREKETAELSREQELHIQAAVRQLETLALLEQERQLRQSEAGIRASDETYIPAMEAPADAGAGSIHHGYVPPSRIPPGVEGPNHLSQGARIPMSSNFNQEVADHQEPQSKTEAAPLPPLAISRDANSGLNLSRSSMLTTLTASQAMAPVSSFSPTGLSGTGLPRSSILGATTYTHNPAQPGPGMSGHPSTSTLPTGLSAGLSSELHRLLNLSTLDADLSVASSLLLGRSSARMSAIPSTGSSRLGPASALSSIGIEGTDDEDRRTERQYLWLERYHEHIAAQQQHHHYPQEQHSSTDHGHGDRSGGTRINPQETSRRVQQEIPPEGRPPSDPSSIV